MLWFDVEKRYNTTITAMAGIAHGLWFDVEKRYNTTLRLVLTALCGCGLM